MPQKCLQVLNLKATFGKCTVAIYVGEWKAVRAQQNCRQLLQKIFGREVISVWGIFLACFLPYCFFNSMYGLKIYKYIVLKTSALRLDFCFMIIFSIKRIKDSRLLCIFVFRDLILKCYRCSGYIFLYYIPSFHLACMCTPNVMFYQQFIN